MLRHLCERDQKNMNPVTATVAFLTLTEEDTMKLPDSLTMDKILEAVAEDDNLGFCLACGEEAFGVEPDARHYECATCGEASVFGAEELLLKFG